MWFTSLFQLQRRSVIALSATAIALIAGVVVFSARLSQGQALASRANDPAPMLDVSTHNPLVRVNLTPEPQKQLELAIDGPYRVVAPGTNRILAHGERLAESIIKTTNNSIRIGNADLRINQVEIVPVNSPSIWVGDNLFRGTIRIARAPGEKLIAINHVPLEDYLASVVNSEMPASFADSAREAQAIIARTYVLAKMTGHPQFDVYASTRSQKYNGYQYRDAAGKRLAGESTKSREHVRATAGIVCTYQGKLFTTYYSAVCGGSTVRGDSVFEDSVPLLQSVTCDWCKEARLYRWQTALPKQKVEQVVKDHLKSKGQTFGSLVSITPVTKPDGGLPYYAVSDGRNRQEIAGTTFRVSLPAGTLQSPHFTAKISGSEVQFSGRGHGHTVGLCQWGADGLGKAGRTSPQILNYYYPGVTLVRLKDNSGR